MDCFARSNAFITWKDHKENFQSNPKCRLINPAKSEIGKASKLFIENINTKVRDISSFNQWRDTDSIITWFESTKIKINVFLCNTILRNSIHLFPKIS